MKIGWRGAFGLVLSAALLWWTLRGVDLHEVWLLLRASNVALFLAAATAGTLIFPLRARRWRTILDPVAPGLPLGALWRAVAIGMMANNVIPARVGEVARAYALTREQPRVPFSAAFASIAVDRVFDALVLFLLMFLALLDPALPAGTRIAGQSVVTLAGGGTLVIAGLFAAFYCVVIFPARLIAIFEFFARRVAPRYEERGRDALLAFASGLSVLRSPRRFAAVLWWTLLHWLLNAFAFWLGFRAVGIAAPFSAALFLQGLIAIGVAVPASPGFFGIFEALATVGLAAYGVGANQAVGWAIGYHLLSFVPITVLGAWYFTRLGLHFQELGEPARQDSHLDDGGGPARESSGG